MPNCESTLPEPRVYFLLAARLSSSRGSRWCIAYVCKVRGEGAGSAALCRTLSSAAENTGLLPRRAKSGVLVPLFGDGTSCAAPRPRPGLYGRGGQYAVAARSGLPATRPYERRKADGASLLRRARRARKTHRARRWRKTRAFARPSGDSTPGLGTGVGLVAVVSVLLLCSWSTGGLDGDRRKHRRWHWNLGAEAASQLAERRGFQRRGLRPEASRRTQHAFEVLAGEWESARRVGGAVANCRAARSLEPLFAPAWSSGRVFECIAQRTTARSCYAKRVRAGFSGATVVAEPRRHIRRRQ
ncbi:hypothetical protein C8Q73DRAFT_418738 [Cubamyces lactineus]|nr:hypothetical protein C8Q73DRAFT_418738 [Cubamyces lactineus]